MSDNYSHIDDLLKDRLGHDRQEGTPEQRTAFMKKAASHRFWNFYPAAFNVYYLALLIGLIGGMVLISTTILKDNSAMYEPANTVKELPESPEPKTVSLPVVNQNNAENNKDVDGQPSTPVNAKSDEIPSLKSEPEAEQEQTVLKNTEQSNDAADQDSSVNEVQTEIATDPLPVVYDTIIRETHVEVTDTMKTEVKQTIEVKKEDKKRRRR
jgi:hypothetical protein